jgi:NRPS condensation-like uncharacterized protein
MNNAQEISVYRSLGAWEYLLWLYDQVSTTHFSLVAQITGQFSLEKLKQTLQHVQQRHPLLRVRIAVDETEKPWLVEDAAQIPLRVVQRQGSQHWEREVERELGIPFIWTQAPLIRSVVVHSPNISELIVTCHHAIADGLSALYLIRDILSALANKNADLQLEPLPLLPPVQNLVSSELHQNSYSTSDNVNLLNEENIQSQKALQQPVFKNFDHHAIRPASSYAHLCSGSFSPETTQLLISYCKQKQISVHSAICAAFLMAIYRQNCSKQALTLKCISPINIRSCLTPVPEEDFGCYASVILTSHTLTPDLTLWDIAYSLKEQLNQAMKPETILAIIAQSQTEISRNSNSQEYGQNMAEPVSYELAVSNLGRLNIPQKFAELELRAIYGPVGQNGAKSAPILGVATLGNQLFFTLACSELTLSSAELEELKKEAIKLLNLAFESC